MQAMCIAGAMKLFRSGFPHYWLQINIIILICQILIMFCLTAYNLIDIQEKVTITVAITLLIFFLALVVALTRHCLKKCKQKNREIYPTPLCFSNDKNRCILAAAIILGFVFMICAGNFFKDKSIDTGLSPSESRRFNQDCLIGIFDQHDLWHLFSALFLHCIILIVNYFP